VKEIIKDNLFVLVYSSDWFLSSEEYNENYERRKKNDVAEYSVNDFLKEKVLFFQ
jgi:hypothetical protein